jgi:DNA-binding protein HU-beta
MEVRAETMNRGELIDVLAQNLDTDRQQATAALDHFLDTIVRAVHRGDRVTITGFGVFEQPRRGPRVGLDRRTGEAVKLEPTFVPVFRPGAQFKAVVSRAQPPPAGSTSSKTWCGRRWSGKLRADHNDSRSPVV